MKSRDLKVKSTLNLDKQNKIVHFLHLVVNLTQMFSLLQVVKGLTYLWSLKILHRGE